MAHRLSATRLQMACFSDQGNATGCQTQSHGPLVDPEDDKSFGLQAAQVI